MEIGQSTKSLLDKKKDIAKTEQMNMRKEKVFLDSYSVLAGKTSSE